MDIWLFDYIKIANLALASLIIIFSLGTETTIAERPCHVTNPYRNYNGRCNNLRQPNWGTPGSQNRLLSPNYTDCKEMPKIMKESSIDSPLPNAFDLSKKFFPDFPNNHTFVTGMASLFGEFLAQDLHKASQAEDSGGFLDSPNCCGKFQTKECFPLRISNESKLAMWSGTHCMDIARTPKSVKRSVPREQGNDQTSLIDMSQLYGENKKIALKRRRFKRGELYRMERGPHATFLKTHPENNCSKLNPPHDCFRIEDLRINLHPSLAALYNVFMREHNRLARELGSISPCLSEEEIFQTARRILIAEIQHITFNEFLPVILGRQAMEDNDLLLKLKGFSKDNYDESIDPTILNEFSAAAFRNLRTLTKGTQALLDPLYKLIERRDLRSDYYQSFRILKNNLLGEYLRGVVGSPAQQSGRFITKALTEIIFKVKNHTKIFDLIALDIHRGRDHGFPGYNYYREVCSLGKVASFNELLEHMDKTVVDHLRVIYRNVSDIDLFVGGAVERPIKSSVCGPTFTCIIAEQFRRLKKGDRFWYENPNMPSSFTLGQINTIKRSSLARVMCDNIIDMKMIQPKVFIQPHEHNEMVDCSSSKIPSINLNHWKVSKRSLSPEMATDS